MALKEKVGVAMSERHPSVYSQSMCYVCELDHVGGSVFNVPTSKRQKHIVFDRCYCLYVS